jgi:toxin CptA
MTIDVLRLDLRPSRLLALALVGTHVAALALAFLALPQWWLRIILTAAAAASLWHAIRHAALRVAGSAISEVELRGDGSARVRRRDGRSDEVRLSRSTFVAPNLAILVFCAGGWRPARSVVVLPDTLSAEQLRQLRVWLRWRRSPRPV